MKTEGKIIMSRGVPKVTRIRPRVNQVAYPNGGGPAGQVTMVPRQELLAGFYQGGQVPRWVYVAENILRRWLEEKGINAWYIPAQRPIRAEEESIAAFLQDLIEWLHEGDGERSVHRLHYEAIRRLPGQEWFAESAGDAAYLQYWCRSIATCGAKIQER